MTAVRLPTVKNLRRHRLLPLLAFLALAWAQMHGLHRGYVCDALGQEVLTAFDHCHGSEDEDHHHDDAPCHSSEEHSEAEETHDHVAVVESLTADRSAVVQIVLSPVIWVATDLASCRRVCAAHEAEASVPLPWPDPGRGRTWPEVLVQTIVLRV